MQATKHKHAKVAAANIIPMGTPADLANATHLSHDDAEKIETLAFRAAAKRESGRFDVIVVVEPWAKTYPSRSDPIAQTSVLLVGEIEDYSEKAYMCSGARWVLMDILEDMSIRDVEDVITADVIDFPEEYDSNPGLKYLPKSAVEAIAVIA